MASPAQEPAVTVDAGQKPLPSEAPPLTNPPATLDQIASDPSSRARAAMGGPGAAPELEPEIPEPMPLPRIPHPVRGDRLTRSPRFEPPEELDFEFTPSSSSQVPNSNLPLTLGLLFSIVASFVIFFVSLAASNTGDDPIMPSFWRALGALAVLITLSFAASWFMPVPQDHRQLMDQLDAQDRAMGRYQAPAPKPQPEPASSPITDYFADDLDKGTSIDLMSDDFGEDDDLVMAQPDDDDDYFDDEDDDLAATTRNPAAGAEAAFGMGE